MTFPQGFKEKYSQLLGEEAEASFKPLTSRQYLPIELIH